MTERRQMRNPAYCAFLTWEMACGFEERTQSAVFMPVGFVYVGIPILLVGRFRSIAERTQLRSGIEGVVAKLNDQAPDLRGSLQAQLVAERDLCRQGLACACRYGLLSIVDGRAIALKRQDLSPADKRFLGGTIARNGGAAYKLGFWLGDVGPRDIEIFFSMEF